MREGVKKAGLQRKRRGGIDYAGGEGEEQGTRNSGYVQ